LLARQELTFSKTSRTHGFVSDATQVLAASFSLGWHGISERYGQLLLCGALAGHYSDIEAIYRRCFPWFCLRLFADYQETKVERWPKHPFPAPEYDAVLAHWRDPEPAELADILLAVCDRHTHECFKWSDKPDKHGDFVNDVYWGWPIEVHMVFRLREGLGLPIPLVDHPLMNTPLGVFHPPVPVPSDALLDAITANAVQQYPHLADRL
jgi:hypothetical protein